MIRAVITVLFTLATLMATAVECRADPLRLLVAVGHRSGLPGEPPLKHPTQDASRVRDVFVRLGGVRPENSVVLHEPTQAQLFATIDKIAALAKGRRSEDVSLLFYFSGHGDRDAVHLGAERVRLRDLDSKLAVVSAGLRIMVTDACRTLETRGKGVSSDEPFAIKLDADQGASGVVRVHASADGEIAQESDELGGAVFTHFWLSGLSGAADANGDTRVTFSESYAWAYGQTLFRSARASGVVQRPSLEADLREGAPIVLTRMENTSAIRFPRATYGHYIVYGVGARTVVGELWSSPERNVALAIPPGKYIVHWRAGGRSAAMQLDIAKNEQREIRAADFRAVPEEVLARKGGEIVLHPNELSIGHGIRTGRLYDIGHELSLRYRYDWHPFALGIGAVLGMGDQTRPTQDASLSWMGVDATAELRTTTVGGVIVRAGAGPRVLAVLQTLVRADAERLVLAGYEPERRFRGTAFGGHAVVGFRAPIGSRFWFDLDFRGDLLGLRMNGSVVAAWSAGVGAAAGMSF